MSFTIQAKLRFVLKNEINAKAVKKFVSKSEHIKSFLIKCTVKYQATGKSVKPHIPRMKE